MDVAGHDPDLAFVRRDDPRAVGADQARAGVFQRAFDLDHVQDGDAFGDADDKRYVGVDGFQNSVRGKGRWDVDHTGVGAGLGHGIGHGVEDRQVEVLGAAFARRHAADHLRAIGDGLLGMEGPLRAGEALADDLGVVVDQYGHGS